MSEQDRWHEKATDLFREFYNKHPHKRWDLAIRDRLAQALRDANAECAFTPDELEKVRELWEAAQAPCEGCDGIDDGWVGATCEPCRRLVAALAAIESDEALRKKLEGRE